MNGKTICKCIMCDFEGTPGEFPPAMSPYHDIRCPKCGTTAIDTTALSESWKEDGRKYGYGDGNVLDTGNSDNYQKCARDEKKCGKRLFRAEETAPTGGDHRGRISGDGDGDFVLVDTRKTYSDNPPPLGEKE